MSDEIEADISPIVEEMGFSIVEFSVGFSHNQTHVTLVVYRPEDLGIEDISRLSRVVRPRLDLIDGLEDVILVVSSPGVDRKIKSRREYAIFRGRGIRALLDGESEWHSGVIHRANEKVLVLEGKNGFEELDIDAIKIARLDYTQED